MSFYQNSIPDERIREYLPSTRIMAAEKCTSSEILIGKRAIQLDWADSAHCAVLQSGGFIILDFGLEFQGGIRLLNLRERGRIRLRFGESVSESCGTPDQTHAMHDTELDVPQMGMLEYGNTAFRFVRIDNVGDVELRLQNIIGIAVFRDLKPFGAFHCSDDRLNQIWETAGYTLLLNMQDYIYDGVKRDRAVWMGDLHPEVRGICAVYNDFTVLKKSLDFIVRTTPLESQMNGITSYTCWWVICLADFFHRTGDLKYVQEYIDYLDARLRQFADFIAPDGSERLPGRRFLDWPNDRDDTAKHAGLQGLMVLMFQSGIELLKVFGRESSYAQTALQKLCRHIPDCGRSKAAAALLTLSGIQDRSDVLADDPLHGVSTFYGFYMLLAKPTIPALELIRHYWGAMLDRGATTFWEDFNLDWLENTGRIDEFTAAGMQDLHANFGDFCYKGLRHSLCHGWSCGPLPFLSERIFGVKFLSPGGTKIRFIPDLGDLKWAEGTIPCALGKIEVKLKADHKPEIILPDGVGL